MEDNDVKKEDELKVEIDLPTKEEIFEALAAGESEFLSMIMGSASEMLTTEQVKKILTGAIEHEVRSVTAAVFALNGREFVAKMIKAIADNIDVDGLKGAAAVTLEKLIKTRVHDAGLSIPSEWEITNNLRELIVERLPGYVEKAMEEFDFLAEIKGTLKAAAESYVQREMSEVVRMELGLLYEEIKGMRGRIDDSEKRIQELRVIVNQLSIRL